MQFSLDSASATLASDGKLLLLAHFVIPGDAHIYWHNPGESGRATIVQFNAPRGFHVGPVQYPGPVRFRGERGAVSYGYAETVTLVSEVVLPAHVPARVEFTAQAEWLACSTVCAIERTAARLELDINSLQASSPNQSARTALDELLARLPRAWPGTAPTIARRTPTQWRLLAPQAVTLLEFFPYAELRSGERDPVSKASTAGNELEIESGVPWSVPAKGLVHAKSERGDDQYFEVTLQ